MPRSPADKKAIQPRTLLLATDNKNSVLAEIVEGKPNSIAYCVYGQQSAQQVVATGLGFNGQLCEAQIGWYLLGNGYRAYNPVLMRFHSPDSWSPFGEGGLNAYMYCGGNPINFTDPTGHMFKIPPLEKLGRKTVARTSSSSSLSPLIPNAAEVATSAPPKATFQTLPALTRENLTETIASERHFIDYGPWRESPLPLPSKQPRFNDSGGQMGIISPNWKPNEPRRYRVAWESEPFQFPNAPVPRARTLSSGATREYYVKYDTNGNPTQSSIQKDDLSRLQRDLRNTKK